MKKTENRAFIDQALNQLGITIPKLAQRLAYKSLRRAYAGEIPLPDSKIRHIEDLVEMERMRSTNSQVSPPPLLETQKTPAAVANELEVLREEPPQFASPDLVSRALRILPWETLRDAAQKLMAEEPGKIDFPALRELIAEMDRRAAAREATECKNPQPSES